MRYPPLRHTPKGHVLRAIFGVARDRFATAGGCAARAVCKNYSANRGLYLPLCYYYLEFSVFL
jgi:hypothetical protein